VRHAIAAHREIARDLELLDLDLDRLALLLVTSAIGNRIEHPVQANQRFVDEPWMARSGRAGGTKSPSLASVNSPSCIPSAPRIGLTHVVALA
jgi:hypothetical protein